MSEEIVRFFKSFVYARNGISHGTTGRNMRIHLAAAVLVCAFGFIFSISIVEWFIVMLCIGTVIAAELINSSIEELCDLVRDQLRLDYSATTHIRDMAAGAVLIVSLVSALIGFWIFFPKFLLLLSF
jgi:diacylglycerol kinase